MLIKQRMQIALQQKSIEAQEKHSKMMRNKLDKLQASLDEQNCYLQMIEQDAATSAYFATASYLNDI